jgi:hypothetical protein
LRIQRHWPIYVAIHRTEFVFESSCASCDAATAGASPRDVVPDEGIALAAGALLRLVKAEEIEAAAVVVASQPEEPTHEFLMGSISNFLAPLPQPVPAAGTAQGVCMYVDFTYRPYPHGH